MRNLRMSGLQPWVLIAAIAFMPATAALAQHGQETPAAAADSYAKDAAHGKDAGHDDASATDPLAFDPDLAIFTLIVFVVLFAVLKKFAWGPISAALEGREQKITDNLLAAQQANEEGKRLLAEYEAKLASAHDDVRALVEEARRDAEHTQQEILAKARADAQAEMARAKRDVELARDQALKELAEAGANLAVDLAGRIVRAKLQPADHAALIKEALQQVSPVSQN